MELLIYWILPALICIKIINYLRVRYITIKTVLNLKQHESLIISELINAKKSEIKNYKLILGYFQTAQSNIDKLTIWRLLRASDSPTTSNYSLDKNNLLEAMDNPLYEHHYKYMLEQTMKYIFSKSIFSLLIITGIFKFKRFCVSKFKNNDPDLDIKKRMEINILQYEYPYKNNNNRFAI